MLVAVMFMLAILIIGMAVAVPKVREEIQRDREVETMNRGKQYIRAIKLYYKKFHAYPPNIDALVKTNEIRFLRKRYVDPITRKDDWKPIMFGQNKAPIAMGFFGQPLMGGSTLAGTGPGGVNGATPIGGSQSNSIFGNSSSSGSMFGSGNSSSSGSSFSNSGSSFSNSGSGLGSTSTTGTGSTTNGSSSTNGSDSSSGSSSTFGSSSSSNQTFGGGGIIGFSPDSPKESILVYKKKTHYNEWEFVYSPLMDQATMQGGNMGTVGQPANGSSSPGFGSSSPGFGSSSPGFGSSSPGFGSSSPGFGSSTTPTQPTTPSTPNSPQ